MAYRRHTHSLPLLESKRFQAAFGRRKGSLKSNLSNKNAFSKNTKRFYFRAAYGFYLKGSLKTLPPA